MDEEKLREILEDFITEVTAVLETLPKAQSTASIGPEELTKRGLMELVDHESIVLEAYKDSRNIWTWGIGVTGASGHKVLRYKDNPQTVKKVIEIFKWVIEQKYLPEVLKAFKNPLTENQLAAALSFHYNTGAINRASWVKAFNNGDTEKAKVEFMKWNKPPEIVERRTKERDLFFDGKWTSNGLATVYPVNKPSYKPNFRKSYKIDIREDL